MTKYKLVFFFRSEDNISVTLNHIASAAEVLENASEAPLDLTLSVLDEEEFDQDEDELIKKLEEFDQALEAAKTKQIINLPQWAQTQAAREKIRKFLEQKKE